MILPGEPLSWTPAMANAWRLGWGLLALSVGLWAVWYLGRR